MLRFLMVQVVFCFVVLINLLWVFLLCLFVAFLIRLREYGQIYVFFCVYTTNIKLIIRRIPAQKPLRRVQSSLIMHRPDHLSFQLTLIILILFNTCHTSFHRILHSIPHSIIIIMFILTLTLILFALFIIKLIFLHIYFSRSSFVSFVWSCHVFYVMYYLFATLFFVIKLLILLFLFF